MSSEQVYALLEEIGESIQDTLNSLDESVRLVTEERETVIRQRDEIIRNLEKRGLWDEIKAEVETELRKPRMIGVMTGIEE